MNLLSTVLSFLETKFAFLFTAVTGIMNTVLSELPDDEIAIIHGALAVLATSLKSGMSVEDSTTSALKYVETQEKGELSKIGMQVLSVLISATSPATT